jgi:hypothetical protein
MRQWLTSVAAKVKGSAGLAKRRGTGSRLSLEFLEGRCCPSTLIDARALSLPTLTLDGAAQLDTRQVQALDLAPGAHTLTGNDGHGGSASFSVAAGGTVDYSSDPALAGLLSGRGSRALAVNGRTITLDARPLSLAALTFDLEIDAPTRAPLTATVLPGSSRCAAPTPTAASWPSR